MSHSSPHRRFSSCTRWCSTYASGFPTCLRWRCFAARRRCLPRWLSRPCAPSSGNRARRWSSTTRLRSSRPRRDWVGPSIDLLFCSASVRRADPRSSRPRRYCWSPAVYGPICFSVLLVCVVLARAAAARGVSGSGRAYGSYPLFTVVLARAVRRAVPRALCRRGKSYTINIDRV